MIDVLAIAGIAASSAINSALPGPCLAVTIAQTARSGAGAGIRITVGIVAANLLLVVAALAILGGTLALSSQFRVAFKWLGAAVMFAMALRMLAGTLGSGGNWRQGEAGRTGELATGLAVGLSSPYNLVFYLALLPLYVRPESLNAPTTAAIVFVALAGAGLSYGTAVILTLGSCRLCGAGTVWLERMGALCLLGFGAIGLVTPSP